MKKLLTILCLMAVLTGTAMAQGMFVPLPGVPGFFPGQLEANHDGSVIAGWWGGLFTYTMTDGWQFVDVDAVDGYATFAGISGDGMTLAVGFANAEGQDQAGYWNADEGFVLIPTVPGGTECGSLSSAYALNYDGTMGTGLAWIDGCQARAFEWTQGVGSVDLGSSGNSSRGTDISGDGSTIVGFDEHPEFGNRRAAMWVDGAGPTLLTPYDDPSEALATSSDGSKICGVWNYAAMYWDDVVGPINIGTLPGDEPYGATGFDISDDGIVVGQSGNPFFSVPRGFIWTPADGMMTFVEYLIMEGVDIPEDLNVYTVTSVSNDGNVFTGAYVNADYFLEPFVVYMDMSVGIDPIEDEVDEDDTPAVVTALKGAFPNPFNPMTTVKFSLDQAQNVKLSVYDMSGRLVRELANQYYGAGEHNVVWQGRDTAGRAMSSGNYILHMVTKQGVETSKMSLVR